MSKCFKLIPILMLTALIALLSIGCDQPDDVLTSASKTEISLNPERFPTNPAGTVYELWVSNENETVSLGKFGYDASLREFQDLNEIAREDGNVFNLPGDLLDYNEIFVSVEPTINDDVNNPASIMLTDFVSTKTIKLTFPDVDSLWNGTLRYNMETVSDGHFVGNNGSAVWFTSYNSVIRAFDDTIAIDDWFLDSVSFIQPGTFIQNEVIYGIENITFVDTQIVFGLDTFTQQHVRYDVLDSIALSDTIGYYLTVLRVEYETSPRSIRYDNFTQDDFGLVPIDQFGWKYKGWVVSERIDKSAVGEITKPNWVILDDIFDHTNGGLLSTGTFSDITAPDDGNPYVMSERVPSYPGEDFLANLPAPLTSVNLVPLSGGNYGKVFVTLEPDFYSDTTNFPLFAFVGDLPYSSSEVRSSFQQFPLTGYMYSNDPFRGFPKITIGVKRF